MSLNCKFNSTTVHTTKTDRRPHITVRYFVKGRYFGTTHIPLKGQVRVFFYHLFCCLMQLQSKEYELSAVMITRPGHKKTRLLDL